MYGYYVFMLNVAQFLHGYFKTILLRYFNRTVRFMDIPVFQKVIKHIMCV